MGIKPCPFCADGGAPYVKRFKNFGQIVCNNCGCRGPEEKSEEEATAMWNRRNEIDKCPCLAEHDAYQHMMTRALRAEARAEKAERDWYDYKTEFDAKIRAAMAK